MLGSEYIQKDAKSSCHFQALSIGAQRGIKVLNPQTPQLPSNIP